MPAPRHPIPALILGAGVTALGVARSLSRAGVSAFCTCPASDMAAYSRDVRSLPALFEEFSGLDQLRAFLATGRFERLVLVPCSDWWARQLPQLDVETAGRFPSVVSPPEVIDRLADKQLFADLVRAHGIPHPRTLAVTDAAALDALPVSRGSEFFVKPRDSQAFCSRMGVKAFRIGSIDDARRRIDEATRLALGVVLQEYMPGPATSHYFIDGYTDRGGRIRVRFARQRLRMSPPRFGNSSYMRSIPLADVRDIVRTTDRLIAAAGLRGVFSIEFKRDARDGVAKVLDVNARPWWYVEFAARSGVNVCEYAYCDALGLPLPDPEPYEVGRTCVYPTQDFEACRALRRVGDPTWPRILLEWLAADQPVFSWRDPMPAIRSATAHGARFLRNRVRRLRFGRARPSPEPQRTSVP